METAESNRQNSYVPNPTNEENQNSSAKKYLKRLKGSLISLVRRGPESAIFIPKVSRGGNWLYEWLAADNIVAHTKKPAYILFAPGMEKWLEEFPYLKNITRHEKDMRFRAIRVIGHHQEVEMHFSADDFRRFITTYLSSKNFQSRIMKARQHIDKDTLVINVRRGDYYSNPEIKRNFGINTANYIQAAVEKSLKNKVFNKIFVVSDDLEWCSKNLSFLNDIASTRFERLGQSMFDDLAAISSSYHLILTNTTFGYWGGYIATYMNNCQVFVPNVHQQDLSEYYKSKPRPVQHLPEWVEVVPKSPSGSWFD
ncbi:alpha-1,2-fucosyltransferase [Rothia nasimurium]|uniref:alpha-1,2-fucosyltransferase n=1 Tax=Rothia nasimurium TaxID=85336 RepID=UPI001F01C8B8|nr:alpha-1,2-fucosyltransferase [Rothia nasimurium]